MGWDFSSEDGGGEKVPELTLRKRQQIAGLYGSSGLNTYEHQSEGYIFPFDTGRNAYEELKVSQAAATLSQAKNSKVIAAANEAYILPKTLKIESNSLNHSLKIIKFDYKISIKSTVILTFAWIPHQPDEYNPLEYEALNSPETSSISFECDPQINGCQNTITFQFNPSEYSHCIMSSLTSEFFPCLIHIYAHHAPKEHKQSENFIYWSFGDGMNSIKIEKNIIRKDGNCYELKTVFGIAKDDSNSNENLCLVCIENQKNIVLKPCSHMCICDICAEPMLRSGQKCPVCRTKIEEIEKIDILEN